MTKADFINAVKVEAGDGVTKAQIEKVLDAAGTAIINRIKIEDSFPLCGLGTLKVVQRAARNGRNPRTGAAVKIPARKAPKFTPGKALKDALKG